MRVSRINGMNSGQRSKSVSTSHTCAGGRLIRLAARVAAERPSSALSRETPTRSTSPASSAIRSSRL
jgi:hypothetical protein